MKKAGPAKRRPPRSRPAKTIDDYLARVPVDKRRALARLRTQIRAAAPEAAESISYGLPTFKLDGRVLIYFGAATTWCSLYAVSGAQIPELKSYDTSGRGTVRFTADKPLPSALVRKIVRARVAAIRSRP